jgi:hypothetical protein
MFTLGTDGRDEVVTVGEDGNIRVWHESGWAVSFPAFEIPHLPVPRGWYEGLEANNVLPSLSLYSRDGSQGVKKMHQITRNFSSLGLSVHQPAGAPPPPNAPLPDVGSPPKSGSPSPQTTPVSAAASPTPEKEPEDAVWKGFEGWLPPEGIKSLDVSFHLRTITMLVRISL